MTGYRRDPSGALVLWSIQADRCSVHDTDDVVRRLQIPVVDFCATSAGAWVKRVAAVLDPACSAGTAGMHDGFEP